MQKGDLEVIVDHDQNRMTVERVVDAGGGTIEIPGCCGGPILVRDGGIRAVVYNGPIPTDEPPTRS